jgi:hypothetical protein
MAATDEARESFNAVASESDLGGGAYFWVYISPQGDTKDVVKDWTVTLSQGDWTASISSDQDPLVLQTDGLSGEFDVRVEWRQPPNELAIGLDPCPDSKPNVGCNSNCAAMIGIVAQSSDQACYWTVWDAFCKQ